MSQMGAHLNSDLKILNFFQPPVRLWIGRPFSRRTDTALIVRQRIGCVLLVGYVAGLVLEYRLLSLEVFAGVARSSSNALKLGLVSRLSFVIKVR